MIYTQIIEVRRGDMEILVQPVKFYEDILYLIELENEPFVPLKPIAENLGLNWESQCRKLQKDAKRWQIRMVRVQTAGGKQQTLCIPLRKLPAWLFSISPSRIKPEIRSKLIRYQEECDEVLWRYWTEGKAENPRFKQPKQIEQPELPKLPAGTQLFETQGRIYLWYMPLDLVAHLLGTDSETIIKLIDNGDYLESPQLITHYIRTNPHTAAHIKTNHVIFASGLRKLFIKNLVVGAWLIKT